MSPFHNLAWDPLQETASLFTLDVFVLLGIYLVTASSTATHMGGSSTNTSVSTMTTFVYLE